jgi:hypothetical protein
MCGTRKGEREHNGMFLELSISFETVILKFSLTDTVLIRLLSSGCEFCT